MAGNYARALELQDKLMPLHTSLFIEANPCPTKYALARLGLCAEDVRLPLVPVQQATRDAMDVALAHAGLIGAWGPCNPKQAVPRKETQRTANGLLPTIGVRGTTTRLKMCLRPGFLFREAK